MKILSNQKLMGQKFLTSEQIQEKFRKLTGPKKIEILYDALDYMQQYNGRSKFLCIAMAMGFNNDEGDDVSYYKR